jgi:DNA-binding NarL/FixJ family response regulator
MTTLVKPISLVIVDDHSILKQGIASMLSEYADLEVLGEASDGTEALKLIEKQPPDVLITDITMPGLSGYELLERIKARALPTRVIFLTMHDKLDFIFKAIDMGVNGYLTKETLKDELVQAIRAVYANQVYYGQKIIHAVLQELSYRQRFPGKKQDLSSLLSKREYEILVLIAEGMNTRKIAEKLFISERTVSNHRLNMMNKCNVSNTVELVKLYYQSIAGK